MKKLLLVAGMLFVCLAASAQKYGLTAGLTSSSLREVKDGRLMRYHVGAAANYPIALGLSLQPEIAYNVKGTPLADDISYSAGYGELGLQVQWGVDLIVAKPFVLVEPYVGGALNNRFHGSTSMSNCWDFLRRLEYGIGVGGGLGILYNVQISCRYYWNMGPLHAASSWDGMGNTISAAFSQIMKDKGNFNGVTISLTYFF